MPSDPEVAWLIEATTDRGPIWFGVRPSGQFGWHSDASSATRFSRKVDAESLIEPLSQIFQRLSLFATEHSWEA